MRYRDPVTGDVFAGRSARDVVLKMKDAAWRGDKPKGPYMRGVARRCAELVKDPIDTRTPETFLASLVAATFLEREK